MSQSVTERIVIRRVEPDDRRGLERIREQPQALFRTLDLPYASAQTWRQRLERQLGNHFGFVACARERLVGALSLAVPERSPRRHAGELALAVEEQWRRRGIGTALLAAAVDLADRWLGLRRLELTAYADDDPAVRLYRKFGFEVEGLLRRYALRNGEFVDVYTLARLR